MRNEENLLIKKAQDGDVDAINEVLIKYQKLISLSAQNYYLTGAEQEDLFQEGTIGLLKALKAYDETKASFKTFAILCIRRQMISMIKNFNAQKNMVLNEAITNNSLLEENEIEDLRYGKTDASENPEEIILTKEKIDNFKLYILENFSDFEQEVLKYMILGYSYREIADILYKKPKNIDNAIQRIKRKSEQWLKKYEEYKL